MRVDGSVSQLTAWRSDRKAELEAEHKQGGQRTPVQVHGVAAGALGRFNCCPRIMFRQACLAACTDTLMD